MRKKIHVKMLILGVLGALLTFRRQIHEYTRIDIDEKEEKELDEQLSELRKKYNVKTIAQQ